MHYVGNCGEAQPAAAVDRMPARQPRGAARAEADLRTGAAAQGDQGYPARADRLAVLGGEPERDRAQEVGDGGGDRVGGGVGGGVDGGGVGVGADAGPEAADTADLAGLGQASTMVSETAADTIIMIAPSLMRRTFMSQIVLAVQRAGSRFRAGLPAREAVRGVSP